MPLSDSQMRIIVVTEQVASGLSLCGAAFVVLTFIFNGKFRKPVNRLVFYATWGNVLSNVATLISRSGIVAGESSSLCRLQAFLIQWFMPADALWTFAMACNVYLSFFRSYDSAALRKLEWKYILACYGVPFIPALTLLFVHSKHRGNVYGSAVLWCWVSLKWDVLRVATFYGPVWIVILLTIAIYVKVGIVVLKWRKHLLSMETCPAVTNTNDLPSSAIRRTYEVTVTSTTDVVVTPPYYGIPTRKVSFYNSSDSSQRRYTTQSTVQRSGGMDPNKATLKYCKCALLFFVALFITWVPSTINRIYTLFRPTDMIFGLNFAAALVLPLQGFWNAIIYSTTSAFAVSSLFRDCCKFVGRKATSTSFKLHRLQPRIRQVSFDQRSVKPTNSAYETDRSSSQSELVGICKC